MPRWDLSSAEQLADWIESSLLVTSGRHFGLDRLAILAEDELGVGPAALSNALNVVEARSRVLGALYPFTINSLAVLKRGDCATKVAYSALLYMTSNSIARQTVRVLEVAEMARLFERLCVKAAQSLFGGECRALGFAFVTGGPRPQSFDSAIRWLAAEMGIDVGGGYRPPRRRDGGVDVVAWRPFKDARPGFPIALIQCTIQGETFTKTSDIDSRLWASWLALDNEPLRVLAIPGTVRRSGPDWAQLSTVVMMAERLRLVELIGSDAALDEEIQDWTTNTSLLLRSEMMAAEI